MDVSVQAIAGVRQTAYGRWSAPGSVPAALAIEPVERLEGFSSTGTESVQVGRLCADEQLKWPICEDIEAFNPLTDSCLQVFHTAIGDQGNRAVTEGNGGKVPFGASTSNLCALHDFLMLDYFTRVISDKYYTVC
jgi:hypothetical protein